MSERHIVLRYRPDAHGEWQGSAAEEGIDAVEVIDVDLSPREILDLRRDPTVLVNAAPFALTLIAPVAHTGAGASGWGIGAVLADRSPYSGRDVPVAVLDTGIDTSHETFAGVAFECANFSIGRETPSVTSTMSDDNGHGTHCAGTFLGRALGGQRIGVAPGVSRALIGKVLDADGHGSTENLFRAMIWAVERGARIVSMSLGFDFAGQIGSMIKMGSPPELAASRGLKMYRDNLRMFDAILAMIRVRAAFGRDALIVAAAGNDNDRRRYGATSITVGLPAGAQDVVAVGAAAPTESGFDVANFSNQDPTICGPGVAIESAWPARSTKVLDGTSMAAPHVAGVAALWTEYLLRRARQPVSREQVFARLIAAARSDGFAREVDERERGVGIASAPLE